MKMEYPLDLGNEEVEEGEVLPHCTRQVMPEPRTTPDPNTSLATACRKTSWLSCMGFVHLLVCGFVWYVFHAYKYLCPLCSLYEEAIRKIKQNN